MHLNHLSLTNFRNYARLELGVPCGAVVLHGDNAQGKTSLLEAIYYLATAHSPHTRTDRQLINWLAEGDPLPHARIVAEVSTRGGLKRIEITLMREPQPGGEERLRKEIRVNGLPRRNLDLLGQVNVVLFLPQDMDLIEGPPGMRRRYLNVTLCQVDPNYCRALAEYEKVLVQRNALLKRLFERGARSDDQLAFWDARLAENGAVIVAGRNRFVRDLERLAQDVHRDLTGGQEHLRLRYQPSFDPTPRPEGQMAFGLDEMGASALPDLPPREIARRLSAALADLRAEEIQRGMTTIGPHRDELRFIVNGRDMGLYGSRGQARTVVMALKLAELAWMRACIGEWPILLLDEVVAELDQSRRTYLLESVNGADQLVLTTAELALFTPEFLDSAALWRVEAGRISVGS
jgi:DNA replication and repair protein RecF